MTLGSEAIQALTAILGGARACDQETETLDFKTIGRSLDDALVDLAEAAACFANARGGQIVVGVKDRTPGRAAMVDVDLNDVRVQRRIFELTEPSLVVAVTEERWQGSRLIAITVPRSPTVHQVKGRATERLGAMCQQMPAERIAAVLAERKGHDWSAEDSGFAVTNVSARALEDARRLLRESADVEHQQWAKASTPDVLRRLGVVAPSGRLTHGGVLLLADNDRQLAHYVHRRTRSGELTTNEGLSAPGLSCLLRCVELVGVRVDRTPVNLSGGQQILIADLPEPAFREAIVNAFMHRDYAVPGAIQIEHSPTRLSVTSPGPFVLGVTPQNILTVSSRPRNPSLATAIRHLGLAETAGVGVDRMYAEMARLGHHPPMFHSDPQSVTVTLEGGAPNAVLTRFVTTLPDEHRSDPDTLLVLFTLLTKRTVTAEQLRPTLQKDVSELESVLQQLALPPVNLIERTRDSARMREGIYRLRSHVIAQLGPVIAYRRRAEDEIDRKMVELVREAGQINSKMVRTVFDVDTPTASRILGDLVERGVLAKTSSAQRGPAVTYGAGPQFPHRRPRSARTSPANRKTTRKDQP